MDAPVFIVGASTRAAAYSARRAGWAPVCADRFADADLRAVAEVHSVADYPADLLAVARQIPRCVPLLWTGGLENSPDLLAELSAGRELLGSGSETIRRVRDPFAVERALWAAGLPRLEVLSDDSPLPAGDWLWKPLAGSAGRGICDASMRDDHQEAGYLQRYQPGISLSAVIQVTRGMPHLVGIARQLIGWGACRFGFAGAIAPWPVSPRIAQTVEAIGRALTLSFDLRGVFGFDFVLHDEVPWLVEVNPRYPATVELYELAWRRPVLDGPWSTSGTPRFVGKRILYAQTPVIVGDLLSHIPRRVGYDCPRLADIPEPGAQIAVGHPVCTLLASGTTLDECEAALASEIRWAADQMLEGQLI